MKQESKQSEKPLPITAWDTDLQGIVCEHCDWSYLVPVDQFPTHCPHCYHVGLTTILEELPDLPVTHPPELVLPFQLSSEQIAQTIERFAKGIPFAPSDLSASNLHKRLKCLFLPMWLVDANVQAIWQAETGFDYHVISHQARFDQNRGGWDSRKVKERRIRWEPRVGRLSRTYHNILAPALDEQQALEIQLGRYELKAAVPYQADQLQHCIVRLPNRPPNDAWPDARPAFQSNAAEECQQAASADHIRQFSWKPNYLHQNWTLMLLPLYSAFYLDDEGNPQSVLINGQNGRISGDRRASMKRATRAALIILAVAIAFFIVSLSLSAASIMFPPTLVFGLIGLVISLLVGVTAVIPVLQVWWFNRQK